jgi:hypothetical protein
MEGVFECIGPRLRCAGVVAQRKQSRCKGCRHRGRVNVWGRWLDMSPSSGGAALFPNLFFALVVSGEGRQGKGDKPIMARLLTYVPFRSPTSWVSHHGPLPGPNWYALQKSIDIAEGGLYSSLEGRG